MKRSSVTPLLTSSLIALLQGPLAAQSSLLERTPSNTHTVVHVQDATVALEQMELNDVYRLLGHKAGDPLYEELRNMSPEDFDSTLGLGRALAGEALLFKAKAGAGLVVEPRGDRAGLMEAMRRFTQTPPPGEGMHAQLIGDYSVESSTPLQLEVLAAQGGREAIAVGAQEVGLVKVVISGPSMMAALSADLETVTTWTRDMCRAGSAPSGAPIAAKLGKARALHGPAGQLEVFTDLSFFKEEAAAALKEAGSGMSIDPSRLISLDDDAYLYGTFALPAGMNVDIRFHLHITPGTLLARLADTMRPLPSDLLGKVPAEVTGLHSMNWDFNRFYELIMEALREDEQERGADQIDQVVAAGSALAGSDLEEDFFGQFQGVLGLFFMPPSEGLSLADLQDDLLGVFLHVGLFARVDDTDATLEAMEAILGAVRAELPTLDDERGFDVMLLDEVAPYDGGLAFGADHFLLTVTRRVMETSLTTFGGDTTRSLLSGGKLQSIFDGEQGAAAVSAFRLGMLRELIRESERGVKLPKGMEGLYETYMVTTLRRVRDGFDLRVQLQ